MIARSPKVVLTNVGGNMVFDPVSNSLGRAAYASGITPAQKFQIFCVVGTHSF